MGTPVSTELVDQGERRSRQGRRFVSTQRRRELLAAFGARGLTRTEFARREGIRCTTLCNWVQREGQAGNQARAPVPVRFAKVTLPSSATRSLEVCLSDGTIFRGAGGTDLAAMVRASHG